MWRKKVNFCIIVKNKDFNIEANKTKNRERYEERDVKLLTDGENWNITQAVLSRLLSSAIMARLETILAGKKEKQKTEIDLKKCLPRGFLGTAFGSRFESELNISTKITKYEKEQ